MSVPFDPSVYFVTDAAPAGRSILDVIEAAVAGGVTLVEYRRPGAPTRTLVEEARAVKAFLKPRGIPLTIDDRVDVVLAAEADGVHLVQTSLSAADARRLLGPERIIGLTVATEAHYARSRDVLGVVDYVSVGPIHRTATLPNCGSGVGYDAIGFIRRRTMLPIVAIGGLSAENAAEAVAAGADGVAVVSAIMSAADPAAAARALRAAVNGQAAA